MRYLLLLIIGLLPLLPNAQIPKELEPAYALYDAEQYGAAMKAANQLIRADTTKGDRYILRGKIYAATKSYKNAFADFDRAVAKEPTNYKLYVERGIFYYTTQNADLAIADYNQALEYFKGEDSLKYMIINNRGTANLMKRDMQTAYKDFVTVLSFDSTNESALSNAGLTLSEMGKPEEGLPYLEREVKLYPDTYIGYLNLGFVSQKLGRYQKAIDLYNKVLELLPKEARSYNNRGFCKLQLGDLAGALKDINYSIELYPENSYAYKNRALVYIEKNEQKKSCADLNKAVQLGFTEMFGTEVYLLLKKYCE